MYAPLLSYDASTCSPPLSLSPRRPSLPSHPSAEGFSLYEPGPIPGFFLLKGDFRCRCLFGAEASLDCEAI